MRRVSLEALRDFTLEALRRTHVPPNHAEIAADVLVTTDSWGVFTHGTKLLGGYLRRLREGGLRLNGQPRVVSQGPAWAVIDGESVLGQVTSHFAMGCAMEKARACGIGFAGVRNSCHFGAAGYYAWLAAREGMIGQVTANDIPGMGPPGATQAVFGTNPFAFAAPAGLHPPIVLDMALSTVAGGKVFAAQQRGQSIPEDWLIGFDGHGTADAGAFPDKAFLATMGGHKGYGLALMNEILSGVLPGAGITWGVGSYLFGDQTSPTNHGASFVAIDVSAMMARNVFQERLDALIDQIHQVPTAEGTERLMVPGEREWNCRAEAEKHGIALPRDVVENLAEVARELGIRVGWIDER